METTRNTNQWAAIAHLTKDAIDAHALFGRPCGGFVHSVLANDLTDAVCRADAYNASTIKDIVQYVYNELPAAARGTRTDVQRWNRSGGSLGICGETVTLNLARRLDPSVDVMKELRYIISVVGLDAVGPDNNDDDDNNNGSDTR